MLPLIKSFFKYDCDEIHYLYTSRPTYQPINLYQPTNLYQPINLSTCQSINLYQPINLSMNLST